MMLLIFAAGLTLQFRFVSTVTILQQTVHRSLSVTGRPGPAAAACDAGKAKGIAGQSPAKELGKGWRFFTTYAEV
jgi:hypothetical protein